MSQIDQLIVNYRQFVRLPWQGNLAPVQRVWFAVYAPTEERRLRANILEFEMATRDANRHWKSIDLTDIFARWISAHDYRDAYFEDPDALKSVVEEEFTLYAVDILKTALTAPDVDADTVVAVSGAGVLFGFTHVSRILKDTDTCIKGRLLVFFPGEYDRNRYRFMNAGDGFNYMAVPITCDMRIAI